MKKIFLAMFLSVSFGMADRMSDKEFLSMQGALLGYFVDSFCFAYSPKDIQRQNKEYFEACVNGVILVREATCSNGTYEFCTMAINWLKEAEEAIK